MSSILSARRAYRSRVKPTRSAACYSTPPGGRYTLWTGDPCLAVYLWHCLTGSAAMPGLDILYCGLPLC